MAVIFKKVYKKLMAESAVKALMELGEVHKLKSINVKDGIVYIVYVNGEPYPVKVTIKSI